MRVEPKDRFLRLKEIRQRIGLSHSTIYTMMKDGTFTVSLAWSQNVSLAGKRGRGRISARQPEEREAWTPPPPPARRVGEKKLPPLVPNEKGAEAAARIAGVVGLVIPPDHVPSDRDIALRFPDWPEMMRQRTAAAYLDLSESAFIREVYRGTLPNPVVLGGRRSWSRQELEASIARLLMRKQLAR